MWVEEYDVLSKETFASKLNTCLALIQKYETAHDKMPFAMNRIKERLVHLLGDDKIEDSYHLNQALRKLLRGIQLANLPHSTQEFKSLCQALEETLREPVPEMVSTSRFHY